MKHISNFEILLNRIAPFNPTPSGAIARRVMQGHFLTLSNTELHRSVYFKVKYFYGNFITNPTNLDTDRELRIASSLPAAPLQNSVLIYDGGSLNNQIVPPTTANGVNIPGGDYFYVSTNNLRLRAGETGLLTLLPFFQTGLQNSLTDLSPSIEVRGYITIEQVSDSTYTNSAGVLINETNPFVHDKANLVISSEHRSTFIDEEFNGTATEYNLPTAGGSVKIGFDFDQGSIALPLAEGKSLYTLDGA